MSTDDMYGATSSTYLSGPSREWESTQSNTFRNWVNFVLGKRGLRVTDLATDMGDGLLFIALLEQLSGSKVLRCARVDGRVN